MRARPLSPGDTVGVVAPSAPFSRLSESTVERASAWFEQRGLKVEIARFADAEDTPRRIYTRKRLDDIHAMFERRDIALVIAALGGTGCHELLPELDFRLIAENPKLVVGFSDFGSLVSAIHTVTGLTTYYGPVFATFGQPQLPRLTEESFSDAILANQRQVLRLGPSTFYADEAWYEHNRTERLWKPHSGWRVVKPGSATGPLFACCLTVLQLLLGTEWWPDLSGRLLFLESEEEASLKSITRQLHHLAQEGVFDTINGLVYGRLNSRTGVAESSLDRLLAEFTEGSAIPVISGFDLAHTDPLVTLPLGQNTSITTEPLSIHLKEN